MARTLRVSSDETNKSDKEANPAIGCCGCLFIILLLGSLFVLFSPKSTPWPDEDQKAIRYTTSLLEDDLKKELGYARISVSLSDSNKIGFFVEVPIYDEIQAKTLAFRIADEMQKVFSCEIYVGMYTPNHEHTAYCRRK